MSPKWLIFYLSVWICGSVLGTTLEGAWVGAKEQTILNTLLNSKTLTATTWYGKISGAFTDLPMWSSLAKIFIWDFAFWTGWLVLIWWFFLAISIGIVFTIITAWIRGVGGT